MSGCSAMEKDEDCGSILLTFVTTEGKSKVNIHVFDVAEQEALYESLASERLMTEPSVEVILDQRRVEGEEFPKIPPAGVEIIEKAWRDRKNSTEVFCKGFDVQITRKDLRTLMDHQWLNDEVINFYLNLIVERSHNDPDLPKVYTYNTFFYPNLVTKGYESVKRWTRKVDIFSYELLLVPIRIDQHWSLAVVDMTEKTIDYYDSMHLGNGGGLRKLRKYLASEMQDKKKQVLDTDEWILQTREDIPRQLNGSDCGVFACRFAEYASRRAEIDFSQQHMCYFRQRMVHEICAKQLM
uniref:ULP_PROTEASE domain-containing protein n=1 Tax=Steinernema glaseri TaxID=37863 RepID=A0A1I7Z7K7_9BILA